MKSQLIRHLTFTTILLVGLFFSFAKIAYAVDEDKKVVVTTNCCLGGTQTGNSNDCVSGTGGCEDHDCKSGETETVMGC